MFSSIDIALLTLVVIMLQLFFLSELWLCALSDNLLTIKFI